MSTGRLVVTRIRGPFRTTRRFERDTIRRIVLAGRDDRLALQTGRRRVELSRLGTRAERFLGAEALRAVLQLHEPAGTTAIPNGWEEIVTPEGARALVVNLAARRVRAGIAGAGALLLAAGTYAVARESAHHADLVAAALILLASTLGLAAGAVWLARGRWEWRIGRGRLTLCRRFGAALREVFEARRLVLEMTTDDDGDDWYALDALAGGHEPVPGGIEVIARLAGSPPTFAGVTFRTSRCMRRTVARRMNDGSRIRDLAAWLAHATGLEFEDRTNPVGSARRAA